MATQADFDRIGNYARMYNPDQNIDRRKSTRTVPLEVLCLGYSRTGTLSMHTALTILGYPTYHFSSIYDNVRDGDAWLDLIDIQFEGKGDGEVTKGHFDALLYVNSIGERTFSGSGSLQATDAAAETLNPSLLADTLLNFSPFLFRGHCGAVTDMPATCFAAELIKFYPDAKIDSWYASWSAFLEEAMSAVLPMIAKLDPGFMGRIVGIGVKGTELLLGHAKNLSAARARSKEEYRKHYALVRSLAPKERLLDFKLKDGWEPLCEFLGKPVPKEPFPHVNDSASNKQSFKELAGLSMKRILRKGAIASVAAGIAAAVIYQVRLRK